MPAANKQKPNLYGFTLPNLTVAYAALGLKPYAAKQTFKWLYQKFITEISAMTDISSQDRAILKEHFEIRLPAQVLYQRDPHDGTQKFLYALADHNKIETVVMPFHTGLSVCLTTQVGCAMGCTFCASGLLKKVRNLSVDEIVGQYVAAQIAYAQIGRITHVVVMGIGEPFDNFNNLMDSLDILKDRHGLGLGARHITVSTCGLVNKFIPFAKRQPQVNLAISLHAPNDEDRTKLMPINKAANIAKLMAAAKAYYALTHRRLTFEYIMIANVNDTVMHAQQLAKLLTGLTCYVNLIPYNPVCENGYNRSTQHAIKAFSRELKKAQIQHTVRLERGGRIDAACGQLRAKHEGVGPN